VQKLIGDAIALYNPTATAVSNISNTLPKQYSLSQNFPNPFNPTTQIRFSIPEASNVKLTIYDAIGREVGVLVNNYLAAGTYNYTWNARSFASGIYFYRIEAKNFVMVKKMILIK
jgi:Secretion system C-terminal sorting domain